ncbi:hypothetical protein ASE75_05350 [Sphingomonas sp. Leaf17]|uniref:hypothetical protein n=1 Tax=Sphingomonas sp. Leaf17 TaxID=1735683 RepID=UPI0006FBE098|nr:hypothetical protein [Sphingomonas sp. Leaf17]KQM65667.1 hypothetical protein ASE75_05350 [Sphingomonas sp. Leaf17]
MKMGVRSDWQGAVLVCGKCSKKVGGGFGASGKTGLAKALAKATGGGKRRKDPLGIVETKCLGICPKGAVVLVDTARPGEWLLIPAGTAIDDVVGQLRGRSG